MASFTDSPVQFNPYISQIPVQSYQQAELYKQGKYDQGVQQVQSYLDETTGLDVDPKYKGYLQNTVNSLQDQVRKVAGSDFSDMQLVNQVGGAVSKIVGDKIIQAGVQSSMNLRSQMDLRKQAQKDGKSSVENDAYLDEQYNNWSKDGDLSNSFKGQYVPYTDINKKWLDVIKSLHGDERLNDVPFETFQNSDGSIASTNKIASVMMKLGISGIEPSKIENAIRATLTPSDMQQLGISGWYQFRGYTPQDMIRKSQLEYNSNVSDVTERLAQAKKDLGAVGGDVEKKSQLLKIIDDYTNALNPNSGSLAINHQAEIDGITANPEGAKAQLYKNGYIKQFSNAFSWKKQTQEYQDSPFTKVEQWNKTFALDNVKENRAQKQFEWTQQQDLLKNDLELKKYTLEKYKIYGNGDGSGGGFTSTGGADTNLPSATEAMKQDASGKVMQAADIRSNLKKGLNNPNMSDGELDGKIEKYLNGDKEQFRPAQYSDVENAIKLTRTAQQIQATVDKAKKEAEQEVYKNNPSPDELLKDKKSLVVYHNGQKVVFTPRELYDYSNKEQYTPGMIAPGSYVPSKGMTTIDQSTLSAKEKILYNLRKPVYDMFPKNGDENANNLINDINTIKPQIGLNQSKVNALMDNKLASANASYVPLYEEISVPKTEDRHNMEGVARSAVLAMNKNGISNKGANLSDLTNWLADPKVKDNLLYTHVMQGSKEMLSVANGDKEALLDLSSDQARQLPTANKLNTDVLDVQNQISRTNNNTTNLTGLPKDAHYLYHDFKNVSGLKVTADLEKESRGQDYYMNVHLNTPDGWKTIQLKQPLDVNGANNFVSSVNDKDLLDEVIKQMKARNYDQKTINSVQSLIKQ